MRIFLWVLVHHEMDAGSSSKQSADKLESRKILRSDKGRRRGGSRSAAQGLLSALQPQRATPENVSASSVLKFCFTGWSQQQSVFVFV